MATIMARLGLHVHVAVSRVMTRPYCLQINPQTTVDASPNAPTHVQQASVSGSCHGFRNQKNGLKIGTVFRQCGGGGGGGGFIYTET